MNWSDASGETSPANNEGSNQTRSAFAPDRSVASNVADLCPFRSVTRIGTSASSPNPIDRTTRPKEPSFTATRRFGNSRYRASTCPVAFPAPVDSRTRTGLSVTGAFPTSAGSRTRKTYSSFTRVPLRSTDPL